MKNKNEKVTQIPLDRFEEVVHDILKKNKEMWNHKNPTELNPINGGHIHVPDDMRYTPEKYGLEPDEEVV